MQFTTVRTARVYGLDGIEFAESPYGRRVYSCRSIREAIQAIPEDDRDVWYLPNSEGSWAYRNGRIAYLFTDENGDSGAMEPICGECAEKSILSGHWDDSYLSASIHSSEEIEYCDCGEQVTN